MKDYDIKFEDIEFLDKSKAKIYNAKLLGKVKIATDTYEISIELEEPMVSSPGQYVWLIIPNGKFEDGKGDRRDFSILSLDDGRILKIAFRNSNSSFKRALMNLKKDYMLKVSGARGSLSLPNYDSPIILISGGVGITPFISMIEKM